MKTTVNAAWLERAAKRTAHLGEAPPAGHPPMESQEPKPRKTLEMDKAEIQRLCDLSKVNLDETAPVAPTPDIDLASEALDD